jgi:hypothetical protein
MTGVKDAPQTALTYGIVGKTTIGDVRCPRRVGRRLVPRMAIAGAARIEIGRRRRIEPRGSAASAGGMLRAPRLAGQRAGCTPGRQIAESAASGQGRPSTFRRNKCASDAFLCKITKFMNCCIFITTRAVVGNRNVCGRFSQLAHSLNSVFWGHAGVRHSSLPARGSRLGPRGRNP